MTGAADRRRAAGPAAQQPFGDGHHVLATKVAGHGQGRLARIEGSMVGTLQRVPIQPGHGLAGPAGRAVIGRRRRVDGLDVRLVGAPARVGLRLEQVVEPLVTKALDLVRREGGVEQDLGKELQGGLEARGRHVQAHARRVPAGLGMERGAEPFRGLGQAERVVALRALGQGAGGEDGRAGQGVRFVGGTDGQHDRGRDRAADRAGPR